MGSSGVGGPVKSVREDTAAAAPGRSHAKPLRDFPGPSHPRAPRLARPPAQVDTRLCPTQTACKCMKLDIFNHNPRPAEMSRWPGDEVHPRVHNAKLSFDFKGSDQSRVRSRSNSWRPIENLPRPVCRLSATHRLSRISRNSSHANPCRHPARSLRRRFKRLIAANRAMFATSSNPTLDVRDADTLSPHEPRTCWMAIPSILALS